MCLFIAVCRTQLRSSMAHKYTLEQISFASTVNQMKQLQAVGPIQTFSTCAVKS